jgi:hypothetical protein
MQARGGQHPTIPRSASSNFVGYPRNSIGGGPVDLRCNSIDGGRHEKSDEAAMKRLTRDDVVNAVGAVDDVTIAQIIGINATADELAEAQAWIVNDDPLLNAGRPLATGRVRELVDILAELEPDDDEDGREAPAAVDQG